VGLLGAGNDPLVCELGDPPLSSLEFHYEQVGARAAELLERLMNREVLLSRRAVLVPPSLVPRRSTDRGGAGDPVVSQALYWIETHSPEPVRPADVARAVGLGLRQLERRVRAARGRTVLQEIHLARLAHARLLLESSDAGPAVVAHQTGFGSLLSFARVFRAHLGLTPAQYRQRHPRPPRPDHPAVPVFFHPPPA
jgi:LacI family transcriptional regulator